MKSTADISIVEIWVAPTVKSRPSTDAPELETCREVGGWPTLWSDVLDVSMATGLSQAEVAHRLHQGARVITLSVADEPAATGWVSINPTMIAEASSWIRPAPGEFYIWDCRTSPVFRGRGLFPRLLGHIVSDRYYLGDGRAWIGVRWNNWRSLDGILEAGFRPAGAIVRWGSGHSAASQLIHAPDLRPDLVAALNRAIAPQSHIAQMPRMNVRLTG